MPTCVIFQLIDGHSRYAVASHVAWGQTVNDAITVFDEAVAATRSRSWSRAS